MREYIDRRSDICDRESFCSPLPFLGLFMPSGSPCVPIFLLILESFSHHNLMHTHKHTHTRTRAHTHTTYTRRRIRIHTSTDITGSPGGEWRTNQKRASLGRKCKYPILFVLSTAAGMGGGEGCFLSRDDAAEEGRRCRRPQGAGLVRRLDLDYPPPSCGAFACAPSLRPHH